MGAYINIGNEGFVSARNSEYVDKSGVIAVINSTLNTERRFSCVTRCRRFGKSMAAKTLRAYYEHSCDSRELFADLDDYIFHRELPTGKAAIKREQSQACLDSVEREQARTKSKGFADLVLMPRKNCDKPAILLELKKDQSANTAIEQIHHRQYQGKVSQYDGQVILVGINYDSKTKKHECKIETII